MNTGTKNAQAVGFEISYLPKVFIFFLSTHRYFLDGHNSCFSFLQLTSTKDAENKTTLLHYLVDVIEEKFPDILSFSDEVVHVDRASRVSMDTIQKTLKQMDSSIKNLETDLKNAKAVVSEEDKFLEVMGVCLLKLNGFISLETLVLKSKHIDNLTYFSFGRILLMKLEISVTSCKEWERKWKLSIMNWPNTSYLIRKSTHWTSSSPTSSHLKILLM